MIELVKQLRLKSKLNKFLNWGQDLSPFLHYLDIFTGGEKMSQQTGGRDDNQEFYFGSEAFVPSSKKGDFNDFFNEAESQFEEPVYKAPKRKFGRNKVEGEKNPKHSLLTTVFEWLDVVVASVVVVVVLFTFVFRMVAIDGDSMNDTLFNGERIIISNMFYEPQRGDIVVISRNYDNSANENDHKQPIIKRVVAVEGDTVDIDFETGIVYVNGEAETEKFYADCIKEPINTVNKNNGVDFPLIVNENCVFVLGDNRNNSLDSRSKEIGQVNVKYILGRAVLRIFPLNKFGGIG